MYLRISIAIVSFLTIAACTGPDEPGGDGNASAQTPGPSPSGNPFAGVPFKMGAMGDSISRGFNITAGNTESLTLSWSTGDALAGSQFNLVKNKIAAKGWNVTSMATNSAVVAESVLGMDSTLQAQASLMASYSPYYVTLQIGANDVCQGYVSSAAARVQFRDKLITVLRTLTLSAKPPKAILVSSIPRLWRLREIPQFSGSNFCQLAWSFLCPQMSVGQAAFEQQWSGTNQAILDAVAAVGGPVVFDGNLVANTQLEFADVSSVDCFHPSAAGQGRLSSASWLAIEPKLNSLWNN